MARIAPAAALLAYIGLTVGRVPGLIYPGRFWAEEATIYFWGALTTPLGTYLTAPERGYYSLFNKLVCLAATIPPLELAPVVTALSALAIQILPAALLLTCRIPALPSFPARATGALLVLLVQPNQEVWLNTINSQFYLAIATAVVLISEPASRLGHRSRLVLLAVAGLTGVVSCMLAPFFLFEWASSRRKDRRDELIVLLAACMVQVVAFAASPARAIVPQWTLLPFVLLIKQWIMPFLGPYVTLRATDTIVAGQFDRVGWYALLALTPYAMLVLALAWRARREARLLAAGATLVATLSFLGSWDAGNTEALRNHLAPFIAGRYYFAPNVLLTLALLIAACGPRPVETPSSPARWVVRLSASILVVLAIATGARDYWGQPNGHAWFFRGPSWRAEVTAWRQGAKDHLNIWPVPWTVTLPRE